MPKRVSLFVKVGILVVGLLIGANVSCLLQYFESGTPTFSQWVTTWLILILILEFIDTRITHVINIFALSVVLGSSLAKTIQPNWGILLAVSTICIIVLLLVVYYRGRMKRIVIENNGEDPE